MLSIKNTALNNNGIFIDFSDLNGNKTAFSIKNSNPLSQAIFVSNSVSGNYFSVMGSSALEIKFSDPLASAFTIKNTQGEDVFRIYNDGKIWSTEVNVVVKENFPDYVFSPDYELMPIDSLACYVETEQHLPNVPTAEQVEENGMNVGEMQVKQMEKIEELTLYLIQINERMKVLEEENKKLQQQLTELQNQ